MIGKLTAWNCGMLFAGLYVLMGLSGLFTHAGLEKRKLFGGLVIQGLLLMFVVSAAHFQHDRQLQLGGLVMLALLLAQTLGRRDNLELKPSKIEDHH